MMYGEGSGEDFTCPKCQGHKAEWYDCPTHKDECYELRCDYCDWISRDCKEVTA